MLLDIILVILTCLAILVYAIYFYYSHRAAGFNPLSNNKETFETLLEYIKSEIVDMVKSCSFVTSSTDAKALAEQQRYADILTALSKCIYCNDGYKDTVKAIIKDILRRKLPEDIDVNEVLFNSPISEANVRFEFLLYKYMKYPAINPRTNKTHDWRYAFRYLVEKYAWDRVRYLIEREGAGPTYMNMEDDSTKSPPSYIVTKADLDEAFIKEIAITKKQQQENPEALLLSYEDKISVLATLLYERYKGIGAIDTLRALDINGVNIGTSGSILSGLIHQTHTALNSVWVFLDSKEIHLDFLDIGTEEEVMRITKLVAKSGNPGPLTEKHPALVTTMYDKTRVLAMRPSTSEYPVLVLRKFSFHPLNLKQCVIPQIPSLDEEGKPKYDEQGLQIMQDAYGSCELVYGLIEAFMQGLINVVVTGRQGSGKTTLMAAAIQCYDPRHTLRFIEMTFELYAREMYPERNIITAQETQYMTVTQIQDFLKKSDAAITTYGEIATDEMVPNFIQVSQVSSIASLASHHATSTNNLVSSFINAFARHQNLNDPKVAEDQVLSVLRINVHPNYDAEGNRYIDYIDEIIPVEHTYHLPEVDKDNPVYSIAQITREYYRSQLDTKAFVVNRLCHFDRDKKCYIADNPPSTQTILDMYNNMSNNKFEEFKNLILKYYKKG